MSTINTSTSTTSLHVGEEKLFDAIFHYFFVTRQMKLFSLLPCYLFAAVSKQAGSAVLPATAMTQVLEDSLEGIYFSERKFYFPPFYLKAVVCCIILLQLCHT